MGDRGPRRTALDEFVDLGGLLGQLLQQGGGMAGRDLQAWMGGIPQWEWRREQSLNHPPHISSRREKYKDIERRGEIQKFERIREREFWAMHCSDDKFNVFLLRIIA